MEGTQGILRRGRTWSRFRRSLRGALATGLICGAYAATARMTGWAMPSAAWSAIALGAAAGCLWPAPPHAALLALGRALGLGERLAALEAQAASGAPGVTTLLADEIARRHWSLWRLATGRWELTALVAGLAILSSTWLPTDGQPPLPTSVQEARPEVTAASEGEAEASTQHARATPRRLDTVQGTLGYSPYTDLMAAVLGIEATGELWGDEGALAHALAEQEGLLRELADRLSEIGSPGSDGVATGEIARLAEDVAREDIRAVVRKAAERGDETSLAAARQAVESVLEEARRGAGLEEPYSLLNDDHILYEGLEPPGTEQVPSAPSEGHPDAVSGPRPGETDLGAQHLTDLLDSLDERFPEEAIPNGAPAMGAAPSEEDPSLPDGPPGTAHGGRSSPNGAQPGRPGDDAAPMPLAVRGADGAWRAYLVVDVPPEAAGELGEVVELTPQAVDLLLRVRAVPVELRDVVRRYFEQVAGAPGGGP